MGTTSTSDDRQPGFFAKMHAFGKATLGGIPLWVVWVINGLAWMVFIVTGNNFLEFLMGCGDGPSSETRRGFSTSWTSRSRECDPSSSTRPPAWSRTGPAVLLQFESD
jgi:hypothetical protein